MDAGTAPTPGATRAKRPLIREHLLTVLDSLEVGSAIPSERRLAEELTVSRPTLRGVIDEMVREGLLERRHGSGTYVAEPKIALPLTMTSFSEDMIRRGMRPASTVLAFESRAAGPKLARRLEVSPDARVWAVTRLRMADSLSMAIEFLHVPQKIAPGLTAADLESGSFYELLRERHGIVVVSATQTIEPTVTSDSEAEILDVPVHAPAFLFERVTVGEQGEVVEFVRSIYRGDRYLLVTELRPPLRSGKGP